MVSHRQAPNSASPVKPNSGHAAPFSQRIGNAVANKEMIQESYFTKACHFEFLLHKASCLSSLSIVLAFYSSPHMTITAKGMEAIQVTLLERRISACDVWLLVL